MSPDSHQQSKCIHFQNQLSFLFCLHRAQMKTVATLMRVSQIDELRLKAGPVEDSNFDHITEPKWESTCSFSQIWDCAMSSYHHWKLILLISLKTVPVGLNTISFVTKRAEEKWLHLHSTMSLFGLSSTDDAQTLQWQRVLRDIHLTAAVSLCCFIDWVAQEESLYIQMTHEWQHNVRDR